MNSFLSWGTLGTFAGATACTGLFTQLLKSIIKKVQTQWLSFLIALVLLASLASNGAVDAMRAMKGNKTS